MNTYITYSIKNLDLTQYKEESLSYEEGDKLFHKTLLNNLRKEGINDYVPLFYEFNGQDNVLYVTEEEDGIVFKLYKKDV